MRQQIVKREAVASSEQTSMQPRFRVSVGNQIVSTRPLAWTRCERYLEQSG